MTGGNIFNLVYVSSAVKPFSKAELLDLLEKSRVNNASQDITGMLLYKDGNFMQLLEGEEKIVLALSAKIARDSRHKGVLSLFRGQVPKRQFPAWTMGFRDLNSAELAATPGFDEFLNTPLTGAEFSADPTRSHKLLLTFKRSM